MAVFDSNAIRQIIGDVLRLPDNGGPKLTMEQPGGMFQHFDVESPHGTLRGRIMQKAPVAMVDSSFVVPESRGQGKGMELYQMALQMAQKKGLYLTSDRTVSDDAAKVYQRLANQGEQVYSGVDNRMDFSEDVDYIPDPTGNDAPNAYNQNSAGGPAFAVVPQGNPGDIKELLRAYMGVGNSPGQEQFLDRIAQTYVQLKAQNQSPLPTTPEEIEFDPDFDQTFALIFGALGAGAAAGASAMSNDIMETIG